MVSNVVHKTRAIYIFIVFLLVITALIYKTNQNWNDEYSKELKIYENHTKNSTTKTILLWSTFSGKKNWFLSSEKTDIIGKDFFKAIPCPVTNCIITADHNYLNDVSEFDAIAFHSVDSWEDINGKPKTRNLNQKFIYFVLESPINTHHVFTKDYNFFNWTMTYRTDSDIPYYYGAFIDKDFENVVGPAAFPQWRKYEEDFFDQSLYELVLKKKKFGAWFVSHCRAQSRRDQLTEALQKYIPVDVYGRCGKFTCPINSNHCNELLENDYRFYLSFENSICHDYVTEKLYDKMKFHIIPIVFGGANYTKFVPPHSIINANDFENVEELSKYLIYLSKNPKEFIKYFWWKKYYQITSHSIYAFCEVCKKLNVPNSDVKNEFYQDIEKWWNTGCLKEAKINF